jgi:hypothetical protein
MKVFLFVAALAALAVADDVVKCEYNDDVNGTFYDLSALTKDCVATEYVLLLHRHLFLFFLAGHSRLITLM